MEEKDYEIVQKIQNGDQSEFASLVASIIPLIDNNYIKNEKFDRDLFLSIIRKELYKVVIQYSEYEEISLLDYIEMYLGNICRKSFRDYFFSNNYNNLFALFDQAVKDNVRKLDILKFVMRLAGYNCDEKTTNKILLKYRDSNNKKDSKLTLKIKKQDRTDLYAKNEVEKENQRLIEESKKQEEQEEREEQARITKEKQRELELTDVKKRTSTRTTNQENVSKKGFDLVAAFNRSISPDNFAEALKPLGNTSRIILLKLCGKDFDGVLDTQKQLTTNELNYLPQLFDFLCDNIIDYYPTCAKYIKASKNTVKESILEFANKLVKTESNEKPLDEDKIKKENIQISKIIINNYENKYSAHEISQALKELKKGKTLFGLLRKKINGEMLTNEEETKIENIFNEVSRFLIGEEKTNYPTFAPNESNNICFDFMSYLDNNFSIQELDELLEVLPEKDATIVRNASGPKYDGKNAVGIPKNMSTYTDKLFSKIKGKLHIAYHERGFKFFRGLGANLVYKFKNYTTFDELISIIDNDPEIVIYKDIIYKKSGKKLNGLSFEELTQDEEKLFNKAVDLLEEKLQPKIKDRKRSSRKDNKLKEDERKYVFNLINHLNNKLTKEEIQELVNLLSEKEQSLLYEYVGKDFDGNTDGILISNLILADNIIERLTKKFKIAYPERFDILKIKGLKANLIHYFDNKYTKEQLLSAINSTKTTNRNRAIILKKCGEGLRGLTFEQLSQEENVQYTNALKSLGILLDKLYPDKNDKIQESTFYYINLLNFCDNKVTLEEIKEVVDILPEKEQELVYKYCKEDLSYKGNATMSLDKGKELNRIFKKIKEKVKRVYPDKYYKNRRNNIIENLIYYFYNKYTKEQLIEKIETLQLPYKTVVYKACTKKLNGLTFDVLTEHENGLYIEALKMLDILLSINYQAVDYDEDKKNLIEYLNNCLTKEQIAKILDLMKEKTAVYKYCGENLDGKNGQNINEVERILLDQGIKKIEKMGKQVYPYNFNPFIVKNKFANLLHYYNDVFSYEELLEIVLQLTEEKQKLVFKACSYSLNGLTFKELNNEEKEQLIIIVDDITKLLKKDYPYAFSRRRKIKGMLDNIVLYYNELLTVEEIKEVISKMDDGEANLIYKCFGENLDENNQSKISLKEKRLLEYILRKLDNKIRMVYALKLRIKDKNVSNLIHFYNEKISYQDLKVLVDSLKEKEKEIIYKRCGILLNGLSFETLSYDEYILFTKALNKLNDLVFENNSKITQKERARRNLLKSYKYILTKEQLVMVIDKMPENEKDIVYKFYGKDLEGKNAEKLTDSESAMLYDVIHKLKGVIAVVYRDELQDNRLRRRNLVSVYKDIADFDTLDKCVKNLDIKYQNIIYKYSGEKLNGLSFEVLTEEEKVLLKEALIALKKEVKSKTNNNENGLVNLLKELNDEYSFSFLAEIITYFDDPTLSKLIYTCCGSKLNGVGKSNIKAETIKDFKENIIPLISISAKKIAQKNEEQQYTTNLVDFFDGYYNKEQLLATLQMLTKKVRLLFIKAFGEELDGVGAVALNERENRDLRNKLVFYRGLLGFGYGNFEKYIVQDQINNIERKIDLINQEKDILKIKSGYLAKTREIHNSEISKYLKFNGFTDEEIIIIYVCLNNHNEEIDYSYLKFILNSEIDIIKDKIDQALKKYNEHNSKLLNRGLKLLNEDK